MIIIHLTFNLYNTNRSTATKKAMHHPIIALTHKALNRETLANFILRDIQIVMLINNLASIVCYCERVIIIGIEYSVAIVYPLLWTTLRI